VKLILVFLINILAYVLLNTTFFASNNTMTGRVVWTLATVVGNIVGITLGTRWFTK
jgi:hypothetical protein